MKNLKPFDLEKAKAGAKVVTRDGTDVRVICWDGKFEKPIIALVNNRDGSENLNFYSLDGKFHAPLGAYERDLFLAPTPRKLFVNLFKDGNEIYATCGVYESLEEALKYQNQSRCYIKTIEFEIED